MVAVAVAVAVAEEEEEEEAMPGANDDDGVGRLLL